MSVSLSVAVWLPVDVGLNVTLRTQLLPGFRVELQVVLDTENRFAFVPVILQERLISAPVPVFLTVSALVALLPRVTLPKPMLVGLRFTVGEFTVCDTPDDVLLLKLLSPA